MSGSTPAPPRPGAGRRRLPAARARREQPRDLAGLREAAGGVLREDEVAVRDDVEDPARARDERHLGAEALLQLGRQTGGAGLVASSGAIRDADVQRIRHGNLLSSPAGRSLECAAAARFRQAEAAAS